MLSHIERIVRGANSDMSISDVRVKETFPLKRKRTSPILRKCEDLMETLWTQGYLQCIGWEDLKTQIQMTCGAFRSTVSDYMGKKAGFYKGHNYIAKRGYLEKFGFVERQPDSWIFHLHHEKVNRAYHTNHEALSFSLSHIEEEEEEETTTTTTPTPTECREREIKPSCTPTPEPFNPNLSFAKPLKKEPE